MCGTCVKVYEFSNAHATDISSCSPTYLWHTTSCETGKSERTLSRSSLDSFERWFIEDGLPRLLDGPAYESSSSLNLFTILCGRKSQDAKSRMRYRGSLLDGDLNGHAGVLRHPRADPSPGARLGVSAECRTDFSSEIITLHSSFWHWHTTSSQQSPSVNQ